MEISESSGLKENSKLLIEAHKNVTDTWMEIFSRPFVPNRNTPIEKDDMKDPENPIVVIVIYVLSMETFLFGSLNSATQEKN